MLYSLNHETNLYIICAAVRQTFNSQKLLTIQQIGWCVDNNFFDGQLYPFFEGFEQLWGGFVTKMASQFCENVVIILILF